jgi:hypothetical protein
MSNSTAFSKPMIKPRERSERALPQVSFPSAVRHKVFECESLSNLTASYFLKNRGREAASNLCNR